MDFENGVIVKIYKSWVDPILVGVRLRRPQTKMGISSGPMTLKFWLSPHFQICNFDNGNSFKSRAPLKRGQVCKKWSSWRADPSAKRWAIFIFSFENDPKGGPSDDIFPFSRLMKPFNFAWF